MTSIPHLSPVAPTTNAPQQRDAVGGGGLEFLETELKKRGVQTSLFSLLETASLQSIRRTIDWWDLQPELGVGVLVGTLRAGGVRDEKPALEREREYGEQIVAWLKARMPDVGGHPAAIAAVIRLHYQHGKGRLTVREHGAEIRKAVKTFDARREGRDD